MVKSSCVKSNLNHQDTKGTKKSKNQGWILNILNSLSFDVLGALGALVVQTVFFVLNF
jgi:hypothetical protein